MNTLSTKLALEIYQEALDAVRADRLVKRAWPHDIGEADRVFVIGAGKASVAMAQAAEEMLGDRLSAGVVVTKHGHSALTQRIRVMEAAHPLPDEGSLAAGRAILEMAETAGERDLVICLLSGGASALMEAPVDGVSLDDLIGVTNLLLRSGATIDELNTVRACLSRIKAGGLARAAYPARMLALVLSDVLGNPLNVIASGPCYDTLIDTDAAVDVLCRRNIVEAVSPGVMNHLTKYIHDELAITPKVEHIIVGDMRTAIDAARAAALKRGLRTHILTGALEGEAREVGRFFAGLAREMVSGDIDCFIAGGETTVTVTGSGKGGRCQELACGAAPKIAGCEGITLLAGGTDGTDGPTDAAGGVVDGRSDGRARAAGRSAAVSLANNDAYDYLDAVGALIRTGPTQSNVGDLVVLVRA